MSAESARTGVARTADPVEHQLPDISSNGESITVLTVVRRTDEGAWRGRFVFETPGGARFSTAEIVYADSEDDFWLCVRDLHGRNIEDLYRSVSE